VRPDDLTDTIPALQPFVGLPLGVYPNIGRATPVSWEPGWHLTPEIYAQLALGWHEEGAQIIGGCCGVTPAHMEAVAALMQQPERAPSSP
jgi:S-methylmethionine-dependent homocysteine/selenocysteine methylase